MGRSAHSPLVLFFFCFFFLFLLVCCAAVEETVEGMVEEGGEEDIGVSLATKQRHRHSGFTQAECPGACQYRCSKTAYKKPCMFFCQQCCFKCRCVPPGTYAHKEVCPCYNNWKTKSGGPKCP